MQSMQYSPEPPPLGSKPVMRQRWSEVSFLHWRISPEQVAAYMPAGCRPDIVDGSAWVGLVAFQMSRSAFFSGPSIPWFGDFPEVNVRLYSIDSQGRRGVVFLSLEASRLLPVLMARAIFGLKYQWSSMKILQKAGTLSYATRRFGNSKASSRIVVRPVDAAGCSDPIAADSQIAIALSAQWAFHQRHLGRTLYCRNHHEPWPLQPAQLLEFDDGLLRAAGFGNLADRAPDSVLYAEAVDTLFAAPTVLDR